MVGPSPFPEPAGLITQVSACLGGHRGSLQNLRLAPRLGGFTELTLVVILVAAQRRCPGVE